MDSFTNFVGSYATSISKSAGKLALSSSSFYLKEPIPQGHSRQEAENEIPIGIIGCLLNDAPKKKYDSTPNSTRATS